MKKTIEAELHKLAQKIVDEGAGKNTAQLKEDAKILYEKLTILHFTYNNLEVEEQSKPEPLAVSYAEDHLAPSKPQPSRTQTQTNNREGSYYVPDGTEYSDADAITEPATEKIKDIVAQMPPETEGLDQLMQALNEDWSKIKQEPEQPEEEQQKQPQTPPASPSPAKPEVHNFSEDTENAEAKEKTKEHTAAAETPKESSEKQEDLFTNQAASHQQEEYKPSPQPEQIQIPDADSPAAEKPEPTKPEPSMPEFPQAEFVRPEEQKREPEAPKEEAKPEENRNISTSKPEPDFRQIGVDYDNLPDFEPLNNKQSEHRPKSLNDRLKSGISIGLNDRLAYIKHLFNGNAADYNRVLSQLNTFSDFNEAYKFIQLVVKPDYNNWQGKEQYEERFTNAVENKFQQ